MSHMKTYDITQSETKTEMATDSLGSRKALGPIKGSRVPGDGHHLGVLRKESAKCLLPQKFIKEDISNFLEFYKLVKTLHENLPEDYKDPKHKG